MKLAPEIFDFDSTTFTQTGADFKAGISVLEWATAGKKMTKLALLSGWWIGDWINHGLESFCKAAGDGKPRLSEGVRLAMLQTELQPSTLHHYAFVARRIKKDLRNEGLSHGHHAVIAVACSSPREQAKWIARALNGNKPADGCERKPWTVSELRQAIRLAKRGELGPAEPTTEFFMLDKMSDEFERLIKRSIGETPIERLPRPRLELLARRLEPTARIVRAIDHALGTRAA